MIVGCYDMQLYCDHCDRNWPHGEAFPFVIAGPSERSCRAEAKHRGWALRKGDVRCPDCAVKR